MPSFFFYTIIKTVFSWGQQWRFSGRARLVFFVRQVDDKIKIWDASKNNRFSSWPLGVSRPVRLTESQRCMLTVCVVLGDPSLAFQPFPWYLGTGLFSSDRVFLGPEKQLSVSLSAQTDRPSADWKMWWGSRNNTACLAVRLFFGSWGLKLTQV